MVVTLASTLDTVVEPSEPSDRQGLDPELLGVMLQNFLPLAQTAEERSHLMKSLLSIAQNDDDAKVARMFIMYCVSQSFCEALVVQW